MLDRYSLFFTVGLIFMFGPQSKLVGPFHLDQGNRLVKRHPSWGVFTKVSKGLLQMNFVSDDIFVKRPSDCHPKFRDLLQRRMTAMPKRFMMLFWNILIINLLYYITYTINDVLKWCHVRYCRVRKLIPWLAKLQFKPWTSGSQIFSNV